MQWWQRASLNGWIKQKRLVGANIKASIFIFVRRKNDITSKAKLILNQLWSLSSLCMFDGSLISKCRRHCFSHFTFSQLLIVSYCQPGNLPQRLPALTKMDLLYSLSPPYSTHSSSSVTNRLLNHLNFQWHLMRSLLIGRSYLNSSGITKQLVKSQKRFPATERMLNVGKSIR